MITRRVGVCIKIFVFLRVDNDPGMKVSSLSVDTVDVYLISAHAPDQPGLVEVGGPATLGISWVFLYREQWSLE